MPVIFVTAEAAWGTPGGPWPLSERWPVVFSDSELLVHMISAMVSPDYAGPDGTGNTDPVLVCSTDQESHRIAASVVAALCTPRVGHLRLDGPSTQVWFLARAIAMLAHGFVGLAESLVQHMVVNTRTYAAVNSVMSIAEPVPKVRDVLQSLCWPTSKFWADLGAQTISALNNAKMLHGVAVVVAHGAGAWNDALARIPLPEFQADLGRISRSDDMWKCRRWVELTVALRPPGQLVQEMQSLSPRWCSGCAARSAGLRCLFCGISSPLRELTAVVVQ